MSEWKIYGTRNGVTTEIASVHALEYKGEWMEDESVSIDVKSPVPVDFQFGDYLTYRGETFVIDYDPTVIKCARRNSVGDAFRYENVLLYHLLRETRHIGFHDIVLGDNNIPYTSLAKFSFYAGSVEDLADRIQANLDRVSGESWMVLTPSRSRSSARCSVPSEVWSGYYTGTEDEGETDVDVVVDNISCRDALKLCYSQFGLSYITKNRIIVIGGKPLIADKVFRYGIRQGLTEIERSSDKDEEVVTKLYAYGSTENLPSGYYANLYKKPFLIVTENNTSSYTDDGLSVMLAVDDDENISSFNVLTKVYYNNGSNTKHGTVVVECGEVTMDAYVELVLTSSGCTFRLLATAEGGTVVYPDIGNITYTTQATLNAFKAAMGSGTGATVYLTDGVDINKFPSDRIYTAQGYPSMLMINNLMLPGFPEQSLNAWVTANHPELLAKYSFSNDPLRPWIRSLNASVVGDREKSIFYDGGELTEIKPSIENTNYNILQYAQKVNDNGVLDDDATDSELRFTVNVLDGGIEWGYTGDTVTITMKDGYCVGREFEVKKASRISTGQNGLWALVLERSYDEALQRYFPYNHYSSQSSQLYQLCGVNNHYPDRAYDTFVVTGIPLPRTYVEAAAERLLIAACGWLDKRDHVKYTYRPSIDNIEMQRDGTLHDVLKPGMQMQFEDAADLGIERYGSASPYLDQITITEGNAIPEYEVVLRDEKEKGKFEELTEKISELTANPPVQIVERATKTLTYVEYDEWVSGTMYYNNAVNTATGVLETSYVWHNGKKWMCLLTGTDEEPGYGCQYWSVVEGDTSLVMRFYNDDGFLYLYGTSARPNNVSIPVNPLVFWGETDITEQVLQWVWTRESQYETSDAAWNAAWAAEHSMEAGAQRLLILREDLPPDWGYAGNPCSFKCVATLPDTNVENSVNL